MASKLGLPIVCVGYAYDRPWRLRNWDRFAIPRPYSRCRAVFGPPRLVPAKLERAALDAYCLWFEHLLTWLTVEAETWATDGLRRPGELPMLDRRPAPRMGRNDEALPRVQLPNWLEAEWSALARGAGARAA
jgi:hypothetical protein